MSFLEELHQKRQQLAAVLSDPEYGVRGLVEDLYPDRVHFIFELLQNAEDTGASKAAFFLDEDSLRFEHNGRPFTEADVRAITNIGKGSKRDQEDQIGRFGVGFKAVFAYSETPHVWCPTFSFKISEMVLPTAIDPDSALGTATRFKFPFNSSQKTPQAAHGEIKAGLEELAETTLLFLSSLKSISWEIGRDAAGEVLRVEHSEQHIEVQKRVGGSAMATSHFLRFRDSVEGLAGQSVAIAFSLDHLPNVKRFNSGISLAKQMKIVPATPGSVAVFFPAAKETSGLRFHLHAPFVPEVSRASVTDSPANEPLFKQLASLTARSLHRIRKLNLLDGEFLAVLPNLQDPIPARYQQIRTAVVVEMINQPLTPTHSKTHAPAKQLLQARASLKELLSRSDLAHLVRRQGEPPQWAIGASQRNSNQDRFLSGLSIATWDVEAFVALLEEKAVEGAAILSRAPWVVHGPDDEFMTWLASRPVAWHQQMYSWLYRELGPVQSAKRLRQLRLVRLGDGSYSTGSNCYFPDKGAERDALLPRVARSVLLSGKSKLQQEEARKLLEAIGVRAVGEAEEVQAVLAKRYRPEDFHPDTNDLERFIALVEKEPQQAGLFAGYNIFERVDGTWGTQDQVYIDSPLKETGLRAYFDALGSRATKAALGDWSQQAGVLPERALRFLLSVGVQDRLEIKKVTCAKNPAPGSLFLGAPGRTSDYGQNADYAIDGLADLFAQQNKALSQLVWKTACDEKDTGWLLARYRNNASYPVRTSASQLVCVLRDSAWIPQNDGRFVRPAQASRDLLPPGFPFDESFSWLKAVHFGAENRQRLEESEKREVAARELGFVDPETFERAKRFAELPEAEQVQLLEEFQKRRRQELPEHEPRHPERRAARVAQQALDAPERITETSERSVSVGLDDVKQRAAQYLREQYSRDGEMVCQVCKAALPFTLDDGTFYFEKVEFLSDLRRRHYQNYLALCPNHGAMFQYANGSHEVLRSGLCELAGHELEVVLARRNASIHFTKTHLADLKAVIESEESEAEADES